MCISPITLHIKERDVTDQHTRVVPCGKCMKCLRRRANNWIFRLSQELKHSTSATFLTFTYEEVPLSENGLPTLVKSDYQKFMKRLRKFCQNSNVKLKYYCCGEYGTLTQRPHYHAIMFNLPVGLINNVEAMTKIWSHGHVYFGSCTTSSIAYVSGYVMKGLDQKLDDYVDESTGLIISDDRQREFSLMSKKIGMSFLTPQMVNYLTKNLIGVVPLEGGKLQGLPRYFKEKIFTKSEMKQISDEYKKIRELNFDKVFTTFEKESIWKKDQIRKYEKDKKLNRLKL